MKTAKKRFLVRYLRTQIMAGCVVVEAKTAHEAEDMVFRGDVECDDPDETEIRDDLEAVRGSAVERVGPSPDVKRRKR